MRRLSWIISAILLLFVSIMRPAVWTLMPCVVLLVTPAISWLLLFALRKHVYLEIEAPPVCAKGETFKAGVSVKKDSRLPIGPLGVTLRAENAVTGECTQVRLYPSPRAEAEFFSRYCGCLRLAAESACLYDIFGILPMKLRCEAQKRTLVMPDTVDVVTEPFAAPSPFFDSTEYAQDRKGPDHSETFQVRAYVPGDSFSQIHWKLSGKQGKLIVRDGSCPVAHLLLVYLDRFKGDLKPEQADALLEAVISVCQALSEAKMTFRVGWNAEVPQAEDVSGPEQFPGTAALLLNMNPGERGGFTQYLRTYGMPEGGRVLYFASELPEEWEFLSEHADARAFLCTDSLSDNPDVVCFAPDGILEALQEDG